MNRIVSAPLERRSQTHCARPDDGQMSGRFCAAHHALLLVARRDGSDRRLHPITVAGEVEQFEVGRLDTYTRKEVLSKILRTWSDHVGLLDRRLSRTRQGFERSFRQIDQ